MTATAAPSSTHPLPPPWRSTKRDLDEPGLQFPGRRTGADYRYFALAVATTFGATDVSITTPADRDPALSDR
ncbi:hypothetical protein [Actinomycetospora flava]|uniref:Uncharacterized protein n=1 Tax=Actinomycetospora flava TaxID=3129232 RepID=A0ABU8M0T8_9PSEU